MKYLLIPLLFLFAYNSNAQENWWLQDISNSSGLDSAIGSRVFTVDINGDDYPDLLFTGKNSIRNTLSLYLNIADPANPNKRKFVDFTNESGINVPTYPGHDYRWSDVAGLADFDNDGDLDLMTSTYTHRISYFTDTTGIEEGHYSEVLLNDGSGHFTVKQNSGMHDIVAFTGTVTSTIGSKVYTFNYPSYFINATGMSFLDYDYDGNIDVYISTWFANYTSGDPNETKMRDILLKGNGDGTFTQIFDPAIEKTVQPMYGVNVCDYNNDGWQDIITSPYCRSKGSLFQNTQNGKFTDATTQSHYTSQLIGGDNAQPLCQWEAVPADFDRDGDLDLLQVSVHGGCNDGEGRTHISINNGADSGYTYTWDLDRIKRNVPANTHVGDMGGEFFDLDGDGVLEAVICQQGYEDVNTKGQTRTYMLFQDENHFYTEKTDELGMMLSANRPHSFEPADFDLDGDQDMFLSRQHTDINGALLSYETLWENNIGNKNFWVSVKVKAPDNCNKAAIGSRITVYTKNGTQMSEIQSGLGHFGGIKPLMQNFGLGSEPAIDSIRVRFPRKDNQFITINNPPADVHLIIDENGLNGFVFPDKKTHPVIAFDRSKANFDLISFGKDSIIELSVLNLGNKDMNVSDLEITDDAAGVYSIIDKPNAFILTPNQSKIVKVKFSPTERTIFTAHLKVISDAFNSKAGLLKLSGECFKAEPMIAAMPDSIYTGIVLNDEEKTLAVQIRNFGELPLKISEISFASNTIDLFSKTDLKFTIGDSILVSGAKLNIDFDFIPQVDQDMSLTGNIIIKSNAYNSPDLIIPIVINAQTRKAYAEVVTENNKIVFPDTELNCPCEQDVTVKSIGTKPLEISKIEVMFDKQGIFTIKDYNPPYSIDTSSERKFPVIFTPNDEMYFSKILNIYSNDYETPKMQISLAGNGIKPSFVVDNLAYGVKMDIYPHPIVAKATIKLYLENTLTQNADIALYDLIGNKIQTLNIPYKVAGEYEYQWDCSQIKSGAYFLIINVDGKYFQKSIIIN